MYGYGPITALTQHACNGHEPIIMVSNLNTSFLNTLVPIIVKVINAVLFIHSSLMNLQGLTSTTRLPAHNQTFHHNHECTCAMGINKEYNNFPLESVIKAKARHGNIM